MSTTNRIPPGAEPAGVPAAVDRTIAGAGTERQLAPPSPARRRAQRRSTAAALAFISPWLIGFAVFTAWPIGYSLYLSLTDFDVLSPARFTGLDNYVRLMEDPRVGQSLLNTLIYTALYVPSHILVALVLAMLLQRAGRSAGFFRTLFFLPKMTPAVAVGVLFLLIFNGQNGLINEALGSIGIQGPYWTTDPAWVKPGLVLMSLWSVGSAVIILLAALQNVPRELTESARIDGANLWQQTTRITLPMISPALFFLAVINTIAGFQTFTEAYTAFFGAGGDSFQSDAALFYVIYLFRQAFEFLNMGYASALAWLLFLVILVVTAVQFVVSRRLVYYEGDQK
jgi:multiple sugar transport system permease protein